MQTIATFDDELYRIIGKPSRLWDSATGEPTDTWWCMTPSGMQITAPSESLCRAAWLRWRDR